MKAKNTKVQSLGERLGETKTRDQLIAELREIEHGYAREITKVNRKRAEQIARVLAEAVCRNCGKLYDRYKSRAEYQGYCSAKCQHGAAKTLGYRKVKNGRSEFQVLKAANEVGSVHAYDPVDDPLTKRIVRALQTTFNYIASDNHGFSDDDLYGMAGDCYVELHGKDKEAAKAFYAMGRTQQEELLQKAFPSYVKGD